MVRKQLGENRSILDGEASTRSKMWCGRMGRITQDTYSTLVVEWQGDLEIKQAPLDMR